MFIDTHAHIYLKILMMIWILCWKIHKNQGIHIFMPNIDLSTVEQMNVLQNHIHFVIQ